MPLTYVWKFVQRNVIICIFAIIAVLLPAQRPATAMELITKGDVIYLGGQIKPGDSYKFADLVQKSPRGTYHGVYLSSGGGFVLEAIEIGRVIRQEGMATIVDASKAVCASACTAIFASGTKRIYLNAMAIADGQPKSGCAGLGFHDGSSASSLDPTHYSGDASALMINAYYEFGVPKAADVISKAPPDRIFQMSGKTALALGIATSLGKL